MQTYAVEESALERAQRRLAQAALTQPMNPASAAISAYVNGMLQSARVDALTDVIANPPNGSWTMQEAIDAAVIQHLTKKAEELEAQALRMKLAQPAPASIIAQAN